MNDTVQTTAPDAPVAEPEKKKHKLVTLGRFMLEAPQLKPVAGENKPARLYWGSYRGNPRVIIHTNDPSDSENNYGKINANMDMQTFEVLTDAILRAAAAEPGFKEKINNSSLYSGPQRFETPQLVNATLVGKDADGRVWISVVEGNRPTYRFFFSSGEYHQVIRSDGTPLPPAESSVFYAQATVRALRGVMAVLAARSALGDEPDEDNLKVSTGGGAGANSGGWKGGQGGGGGGWKGGGQNNWKSGGGNGGGWKGNQGGGWQNRQGGGGGGGWQNRQNGGGGGWQNRQGGNQPSAAPAAIANDDLTF